MNSFDESVDFLVVGSGGGSMCAALVLRDVGKSVAILEKAPVVGGTTARSGGAMWIPNNRLMKLAGIEDSTEKAVTYLDNLIGDNPEYPAANSARRLKYISEAPRMIDFITAQGVKLARTDFWPDYYDTLPGGSRGSRSVFSEIFDLNELGPWANKIGFGFIPQPVNLCDFLPIPYALKQKIGTRLTIMLGAMNLGEMMKLPHFKRSWAGFSMMLRVGCKWLYGKLTGKRYVAAGVGLQGQMLKACLAANVDIRVNCAVDELIEEGGKVVGVVTNKDGKPWRIKANLGVLINAGGFAHNQAMRDKYIPGSQAAWSSAVATDTGEMLQTMMDMGAAVGHMQERVGNQTSPMPGFDQMPIKPAMQAVTAKPHCILVDQTGVRYQAEGGSYSAYCKGMLSRNSEAPSLPSWAIFDQRLLDKYMFGGCMPGQAVHKVEGWKAAGYMKQASSIEALAQQIEMDPAVLKATVERFNGFVARGVDEDFHRGESYYDTWLGDPYKDGNPSLGDIAQEPFYAAPVLPGDMGTYGGVITDTHARVLREDGTVMEGLYATGVSTAGVMGPAYPGGGSSVGPSFTFGYIAARHAVGLE
ncbi:FAD-binding protein [Halioxenophilus aromaticivorans]|uniref:3-oxosteroid 1-dehydrogenase n=1 Tax=Halioxenophilus aromaticivorans TaxID=1306992 RepID=A0AAV3TZ75_9ALTE